MDRFGIPGNQRVPPVEVAPLVDEPVGAGGRQPADLRHGVGRQTDAIVHGLLPVLIVLAPAAVPVEQRAGDIGPGDFAGIPILELVQAAPAAAVAQAFPFVAAHLGKRLGFPEWAVGHVHSCFGQPVSFRSLVLCRKIGQKHSRSGATNDAIPASINHPAAWPVPPAMEM